MPQPTTPTFQGFDTQVAEAYREWSIFLVLQMRKLEAVTAEQLPNLASDPISQPINETQTEIKDNLR